MLVRARTGFHIGLGFQSCKAGAPEDQRRSALGECITNESCMPWWCLAAFASHCVTALQQVADDTRKLLRMRHCRTQPLIS